MSVNYIIPHVDNDTILRIINNYNNFLVLDNGDEYSIETQIPKQYALQKRIAISQFAQLAPDYVHQGGNKSYINLVKSTDGNSWFWCNAVTHNHPEVILDFLINKLDEIGINTTYYPDTNDEYFEFMDNDLDDDN